MNWIAENQILSGLAAALVSVLLWLLKRKFDRPVPKSTHQIQTNSVVVNNHLVADKPDVVAVDDDSMTVRNKAGRDLVRILFVDDDTRFRVVKMMQSAGWPNVKITKDIKDLGAPEVIEAQVLFVDIQGVGKALGFADEGLGLSLAIKERYPEKKVVIYSAQTDGDRFHRALNRADGSLSKNAEPYQFISLVEELMGYK